MKLERMARLRELCIKNDWFTHGGNCSYDKMLTAFGERTANAQEIAAMIWVNSDTDLTISNITEMILNIEGSLKGREII